MPTAYELCYLAGVLDSDGCISISKMKPGRRIVRGGEVNLSARHVLTVNIINTSVALMEWLVATFGGRYKQRVVYGDNHRPTYDWWFNNGKAADLLEQVGPFLIIKRAQAELGVSFVRGWVKGSKLGIHPDELARRERAYQKMKVLNLTGCAAATTECPGPLVDQPRVMRQSELMRKHERNDRSVVPAVA